MEIIEVNIGKQIWMDKNLVAKTFQNGDFIKEAKTDEEWANAAEKGEPAWCYYNNDSENFEKYGIMYNGFAVSDPRGLAPKGWHIPEETEWNQLADFLGGEKNAGLKLKSSEGWDEHPIPAARKNGTNESGFTAIPGGYRNSDGEFKGIKQDGSLWSSTDKFGQLCYVSLDYAESSIIKSSLGREYGFYVRCIKD